MANYKVLHMQFGALPEGRVTTDDELKELGYDTQRALRLGAIEETDEDATEEPIPIGPLYGPSMSQQPVALVEQESPPDQPMNDPKRGRPKLVAGGRVVDHPGMDRPTIADDVKTGNAVEAEVIEGGAESDEIATTVYEEEQLTGMRMAELRQVATGLGIDNADDMKKKPELINAIMEQQTANQEQQKG